jgi:hypothetical protein
MSSNIKWNPQGFRDLEKQIQRYLEHNAAPQVQSDRLNPLSRELNELSRPIAGKPQAAAALL